MDPAWLSVTGLPCAEFSDMPGLGWQMKHADIMSKGTGTSGSLFHALLDFNTADADRAHTVEVYENVGTRAVINVGDIAVQGCPSRANA